MYRKYRDLLKDLIIFDKVIKPFFLKNQKNQKY